MALIYTPETTQNTTPTTYDEFVSILANLSPNRPQLLIDCDRKRVQHNGKPLNLTRQELDLLIHLATHADETISRNELFTTVWAHRDLDTQSRTVDIHIRRLRAKLHTPDLISTIRGHGYCLNSNPTITIRTLTHQQTLQTLAA